MGIVEYDRDYYAERMRASVYSSGDVGDMPYRLFVPGGGDGHPRRPLVLYLHGAGERGDDNWLHLRSYAAGWTSPEVQAEYPCFVLLPQCPLDQQWVDTPFEGGSYASSEIPMSRPLTIAKALLEEVIATHAVDPRRVYVMGASMGGYGTWDFITRFPHTFAAAVPICGAGDPNQAERLVDLPIWAFHGALDDAVPTSGSREMVHAIRALGGKRIRYTEYPGVRHESFQMAWQEPDLPPWLCKFAALQPA